jgi:hypothetical protein
MLIFCEGRVEIVDRITAGEIFQGLVSERLRDHFDQWPVVRSQNFRQAGRH